MGIFVIKGEKNPTIEVVYGDDVELNIDVLNDDGSIITGTNIQAIELFTSEERSASPVTSYEATDGVVTISDDTSGWDDLSYNTEYYCYGSATTSGGEKTTGKNPVSIKVI